MRTLFYTFLFTLLLISCTDKNTTKSSSTSDKERITEVFNNFKSAILENKGTEAVSHVHKNTTGYFSYVLREAKYSDSTEVSSFPPKDKFLILLIRQFYNKEEIKKLNRKTLMAFVIDKWFIGKDDIQSLTLGKIVMDTKEENRATARIRSYDLRTPYSVDFYKENNRWKIDLSPTYADITRGLRKMINKSGMKENEFILWAIKEFSGQAPRDNIWDKVLKIRKGRIKKTSM
ncbi:MAG: hypothetical protein AAF611_15785 [Bacteroidota bacterium]